MAIDELDDDLCLYLGPDRTGSLLEVITARVLSGSRRALETARPQ
jgi:hypothetical protein